MTEQKQELCLLHGMLPPEELDSRLVYMNRGKGIQEKEKLTTLFNQNFNPRIDQTSGLLIFVVT